jgi:hypothetical protein
MKAGYPPFQDASNLTSIEQKWPAETRKFLEELN